MLNGGEKILRDLRETSFEALKFALKSKLNRMGPARNKVKEN